MSTRAVYSFKDKSGTHHVYKHHDGYPEGAAEAIQNARASAWPLPRFEADEFAAAFAAGNKGSSGGVRLTQGPERHGDLEYRYVITFKDGQLWVTAYDVDFDDCGGGRVIYDGPQDKFAEWAERAAA